jgi:predicted DNA-binding transcriptional regulator AlpA
MTRLTIREASEKFGLSRARLYKLLAMQRIVGFRSSKQGGNAESWVNASSLEKYLCRPGKKKNGAPMIMGDGDYVPVRIAVEKTNYSRTHIYRLARQGSINAKRPNQGYGLLISLNDLKKYK